jgi:hypothetical protein
MSRPNLTNCVICGEHLSENEIDRVSVMYRGENRGVVCSTHTLKDVFSAQLKNGWRLTIEISFDHDRTNEVVHIANDFRYPQRGTWCGAKDFTAVTKQIKKVTCPKCRGEAGVRPRRA